MVPGFNAGVTRSQALRALTGILARAGIDSAGADARLLLCAAGGVDALGLIRDSDAPLDEDFALRLTTMAKRRTLGEPVSRILSKREFWGLPLKISPDVLDPRPETETLIAAAVEELRVRRNEALRVLDLGAGSGAILCALLTEFPHASGVGVELSPHAAAQARANLAACGLADRSAIVVGSWTSAVRGAFDIVASNPPYIARGQIGGLQTEVREYDPHLALDGGPDGLDAYRALASEIGALLDAKGRFFLEVGVAQAPSVIEILANSGLTKLATSKDLAGIERVVWGAAP